MEHLPLVKKEEFKRVLAEGDVIAESLFDILFLNFPIEKFFELTDKKPIYNR